MLRLVEHRSYEQLIRSVTCTLIFFGRPMTALCCLKRFQAARRVVSLHTSQHVLYEGASDGNQMNVCR